MRKIKATIINGHEVLPNGVLILNDDGICVDLVPESLIDFTDYETFDGFLVPGFVNAHCHLELSHLKNKIEKQTGLVDFVMAVQKFRDTEISEIELAMHEAEVEMINNGIVAVGDISNGSHSFEKKSKSSIYYHTFIEALSFSPNRAAIVLNNVLELKKQARKLTLSSSISPHAPYSVSRELFSLLANQHEQVYTLHHLESLAEIQFLKEKTGDFLKLYSFFNINIDEFNPEEESATNYWLPNFEVSNLILVHNTFLSDDAFEAITNRIENIYWCLCPNANLYIENRLPNIPALIKKGAKVCIGTDSLASNSQLNILDELHTIKKAFPEISSEYLLQCASINGAEALGIEAEFGKFFIGKKNPLVIVDKF
jgi:cytosine/adenosine deaminase-related metal-dependent hydrolase